MGEKWDTLFRLYPGLPVEQTEYLVSSRSSLFCGKGRSDKNDGESGRLDGVRETGNSGPGRKVNRHRVPGSKL